jgi:hypothetical protein
MTNSYTSNPFNIPNANADGAQNPAAFDAGNQGNTTQKAGFGLNADGTYTPHTADGQPGAPVQATVTVTGGTTVSVPAQGFAPILPTKPRSAAAIFNAFEELAQVRMKWEDNQLRASNEVLYAIVDYCYDIYDMTQRLDDVRAKFVKLYADKYPATKAGTAIATKIIWAVFGKKLGQRAATYSRVLRLARAEILKTPGLTFRQYLARFGGIEEVRRNGNGDAAKAKRQAKVDIAKAKLKAAKGLARNISMLLPEEMQEKNGNHSFRAALLREEADGTFTVVMVSKSEGTVETMLGEFENRSTEPAAKTQSQPESVQDTDDLARRIAANATL